jgi:protein-tyrosine phosphatase
MSDTYSRHFEFDFLQNCRDLGGYRTATGRKTAWRRLFRSGEPRHTTGDDLARLKEEISLGTVLDLRSSGEIKSDKVNLFQEAGINYHNVPFLTKDSNFPGEDDELYKRFSNMGQFYALLLADKQFGERVVAALEIVADPENHPVLFHCTIGKDRTGILAGIILSVLGVDDRDIIEDYTLTAPHMGKFIDGMKDVPEAKEMLIKLPAYFWEAAPESMVLLLETLRKDYGSALGYVEAQDIEPSLLSRLENSLLDD